MELRRQERLVSALATAEQEVTDWCIDKGWYDKPVSFLEAMALLHSEVSEAVEAYREHELDPFHSVGHIVSAEDEAPVRYAVKPEGVGSELADVFIRLLDDCARFHVDLAVEYRRKMDYNKTRPYRHGGKAK